MPDPSLLRVWHNPMLSKCCLDMQGWVWYGTHLEIYKEIEEIWAHLYAEGRSGTWVCARARINPGSSSGPWCCRWWWCGGSAGATTATATATAKDQSLAAREAMAAATGLEPQTGQPTNPPFRSCSGRFPLARSIHRRVFASQSERGSAHPRPSPRPRRRLFTTNKV
jgi:hypothetical protein